MHVELSRYTLHGQLSRSCVPNLSCVPNVSCDRFNQSCSAKSKIAPAVLLSRDAKQTLPNEPNIQIKK